MASRGNRGAVCRSGFGAMSLVLLGACTQLAPGDAVPDEAVSGDRGREPILLEGAFEPSAPGGDDLTPALRAEQVPQDLVSNSLRD